MNPLHPPQYQIFSSNSMGFRKWWRWNDEYEEQKRCDSELPNITLFPHGDDIPQGEEEGGVQKEEFTILDDVDNETLYFTSSASSLLSFSTCPSSLEMDSCEGEYQFFWDDSNDEDEIGVPYSHESAVAPLSQEYMEESAMDHHVTNIDNENEKLENETEVDINKGQLKAEEPKLDIEFFNNPLIFEPPEAEKEYQDKVGEDEDEEGLPRSSSDLVTSSSSSSSSSTKDNEKETGMVTERQRIINSIQSVAYGHFKLLVEKYIAAEGVNIEKWKEIVCSLSWEAASLIKLDASKDGKAMDPRGYVKVKCIACGNYTQSELIKGVVFKKNVAHKHMPKKYQYPRLLLLGGALEFDGPSSQLSSFDTLLQQENDFFQMILGKVEAHSPNVVLVEKTVSRPAQEFFLAKDISLVSDVNKSRLEYVAQCTGAQIIDVDKLRSEYNYIAKGTGAQIVSSVNNLNLTNAMHCELFHVEKFVEENGSSGDVGKKFTKHFMFFEGCPRSLGCSILLKGASEDELKKVKRVVHNAVFLANHLLLETSFLADQKAGFLGTLSHSTAIVDKSSEQMHLVTSINTINGFAVPVQDKAHAGDFKEHNKDQSLNIFSCPLKDSQNNIELDSESSISSGPLQMRECIYMPICRDVCPTNELMLEKSRNAGYCGAMMSSVSSSPLVSGLSDSLNQTSGETFPPTDKSSYAAITSYLGMKNSESKNCSTDDVSTFLDTSGTDDCKNIFEELIGIVQSKNKGISDIQDDFETSKSQPEIESKNTDSILVSFSSYYIMKKNVCEQTFFFRINYYGSFDKPLERFLKDRLFDQSSRCHACDQPPTAHAYFYTRQEGRLAVYVRQLHSDFFLPSVGEGKIWMWHRCLKCEWKDGKPQGNRRVVMSNAASLLSFGKFLELVFLNHSQPHITSCGHCLQRDCLQFYGLDNMVACFHYSAISIFGVCLPSKIMFNRSNHQEWLVKEAAEVAEEGSKFFSEILHLIHRNKSNVCGGVRDLSKIEKMLLDEWQEFQESLQKAIAKSRQPGQPNTTILVLNCLRRQLLFQSYVWECRFCQFHSSVEVDGSLVSSNSELQNLDSSGEKQQRSIRKTGYHMTNEHDGGFGGLKLSSVHGDGHEESSEYTHSEETKLGCKKVIADEVIQSLNIPWSLQDVKMVDQRTELPEIYNESVDLMVNGKQPIRNFDIPGQKVTSQSVRDKCSSRDNISGKQSLGSEGSKYASCLSEGNWQFRRSASEGNSCDVSDLSETFNAVWTGAHLFPSQALNKLLNSEEVSELPFENLGQQIQSTATIESGNSSLNMQDKNVLKPSASTPSLPAKYCNELKDFKNLIWHPFSRLHGFLIEASQEFLNKLISQYTPVHVKSAFDLLNQGAGRILLPSGIGNIVIPVYDDQSTSLIAYALSSKQYWAQMSDNTLEKERDRYEDIQRENIDSIGMDRFVSQLCQNIDLPLEVCEFDSEGRSTSSENASTSGSHGNADSEPWPHTKVPHAEISFSDVDQLGKAKYSVICYHAKKFSALRKICCVTELDYISSLSRCKKWNAQGGKSKVSFAKTLDDRFIIKQLTKTELESFLEFAPEYFKHLTLSLSTGSLTCLAKVLGIYQVSIKQSKSAKEGKMDLMVMENLFFGRSVTRIYDLKGSLRNRYNPDPSGVLQDQNFIEAMHVSQIYVGKKAKNHLERAVWNDTSFLNSINVMDYSLLVGVDEERQQLVMGIIDFVRQYTWDKHLETLAKASGILGGPKNEPPTVISPKEYKKRFRRAISSYFQTVPDP